ncbi:hypothetical protein NQK81_01535 [Amycolatopsis roodepoortensis]|uniref:hypothetical protein n=1 Tax=Amycolatopsis roodepoortensis TaxID=700274 RepID=UPI00214CAFA7|nr:hypothetical protein [Amycolatopsis roodepoortensis]UUV32158.1 hypothetical protein NQK81_01535 [Amycolatopsis roodepoortensis]
MACQKRYWVTLTIGPIHAHDEDDAAETVVSDLNDDGIEGGSVQVTTTAPPDPPDSITVHL